MSLFTPSRRGLILGLTSGAAGFAATGALAQQVFAEYPFQLGVASGDPAADGFVIWTRLAPRPLETGYGMPAAPMSVSWEVAEDRGFNRTVASGEVVARPELGHAVHVEVEGLQPARDYFYRFSAGRERSLTGRARTAPAAGAPTAGVRFGVVGCQNYEQGYYTAHRYIADETLDFIYCYGDYIYEGRGNRVWNSASGPQAQPRPHLGGETFSLDDYRRRYAQYKMDVDLQAAHAAAPWFVTWDDHEIDNNWVGDLDQEGTDPAVFRLRQQAAVQAFYENMPLRRSAFPRGSAMQLYRRAVYGDLLDLNLLDTRQYRTDQPCNERWASTCDGVNDPAAEVLGQAQEAWLFQSLQGSRARWKALAQQVMLMDLNRNLNGEVGYNLDTWAGYRVPRARLLTHVQRRNIDNVVVLTGDEHQNYAGELFLDGRNPEGRPIATEFVTTSISSSGDGVDQRSDMARIQSQNPFLKFNNAQRGYVVCDLTHARWQTDFKVLDRVSTPGGVLSTRRSMAVEAGNPTLVEA